MTKKINKVTTTPDTQETKNLQTNSKTILEQKFDELTYEKKREYLCIVFGTVRGTTGFFDMWFTASMSDYKTFDVGNGDMADVIIKNSGMYSDEGGGSETDNSIVIIFQGKIYGSEKVRYFETNKIDRPHLNYKEIIDCKFDKSKDEFIITVKCADESTKIISAKNGNKYNFEEALISKLRVPKELLQKEEEIKKLLQEEISKEEKELATQNMYQRAVDIFILKENRIEVQKYINKPGIKLSEDQKKSYVEYLLNGRKQGYGQCMRGEDMKKLLPLLKTFEDQNYVKSICEKMLGKSAGRNSDGEMFQFIKETAQLGGFDIQDWYTKKIDYYCQGDYYFKEMGKVILESKQDEKIRYKKYYDLHKPTDQSKLDIIAQAIGENIEDLLKESFLNYIEKADVFGSSRIEYFLKVMKEKGYEEYLYGKVFDKILPDNYNSLRKYADSKDKVIDNIIEIRSYTDKKINDNLLFEMFYYTKEDNKDNLWSKISLNLSTQEINSTLEMMIDKYLDENKKFCDQNLIIKRGFNDISKILKIFDKIICEELAGFNGESGSKYCNSLISTLKSKNLLSKDNLLDQIHGLYKNKIDEIFQKCTINNFIYNYGVHFDDKDFLEKICSQLIINHGNNFSSGKVIALGFKEIGFSQDRIQNFINKYSENISILCNLIEGFGLNIDKLRVNTLIENLFNEGKVLEVEKLSKALGLYDLRKKKIITWKLENNKLDYRDASRAIKEGGLDKSYYKYVIDIHINKGELKSALELAEANDLLISQKQFDRYIGRNERLRKADEERKLREKQEREKLATEMMKFVAEGNISCKIDYQKDQKYVLVRNKEKGITFASKNLEWHKDIVSNLGENPNDVVGGGRIVINHQEKIFKIYGSSGDFGRIYEEYNQILMSVISKEYPEYKIIIE